MAELAAEGIASNGTTLYVGSLVDGAIWRGTLQSGTGDVHRGRGRDGGRHRLRGRPTRCGSSAATATPSVSTTPRAANCSRPTWPLEVRVHQRRRHGRRDAAVRDKVEHQAADHPARRKPAAAALADATLIELGGQDRIHGRVQRQWHHVGALADPSCSRTSDSCSRSTRRPATVRSDDRACRRLPRDHGHRHRGSRPTLAVIRNFAGQEWRRSR